MKFKIKNKNQTIIVKSSEHLQKQDKLVDRNSKGITNGKTNKGFRRFT